MLAPTRLCLPGLAAQWLRLGKIFIAIARRFARLNQAGTQGAETRALAFELNVRCALIVLTRQLADLDAPQTAEDARAHQALQAVQTALIMLAMVTAKMRAELAAHARAGPRPRARLKALPLARANKMARDDQRPRARPIGARGYFDSS